MLRLARLPAARLFQQPRALRHIQLLRPASRPLHRVTSRRARFSTGSTEPEQHSTLPPDASLSQRLKHLIKTYGWYGLGVYGLIGVLDFGVAFAGINLIGQEPVAKFADAVKKQLKVLIRPFMGEQSEAESEPKDVATPNGGLYAMLVLAYTVHKTIFFPVRVGLTAWSTPRLVGWLRIRGWAGGAGTRRAATEMRDRLKERRDRKKHAKSLKPVSDSCKVCKPSIDD